MVNVSNFKEANAVIRTTFFFEGSGFKKKSELISRGPMLQKCFLLLRKKNIVTSRTSIVL